MGHRFIVVVLFSTIETVSRSRLRATLERLGEGSPVGKETDMSFLLETGRVQVPFSYFLYSITWVKSVSNIVKTS